MAISAGLTTPSPRSDFSAADSPPTSASINESSLLTDVYTQEDELEELNDLKSYETYLGIDVDQEDDEDQDTEISIKAMDQADQDTATAAAKIVA